MGATATAWHLTRRFVGSLSPVPPSADDEEWVDRVLSAGERRVWLMLDAPDRRHAVAVARQVDVVLDDRDLAGFERDEVLAAALLHDSGKVFADFGTFARVGATLVWFLVPNSMADRWSQRGSGWRRRLSDYRRHPELGSIQLARHDARPLVRLWAAEHHRSLEAWATPHSVGLVLKQCDDD